MFFQGVATPAVAVVEEDVAEGEAEAEDAVVVEVEVAAANSSAISRDVVTAGFLPPELIRWETYSDLPE